MPAARSLLTYTMKHNFRMLNCTGNFPSDSRSLQKVSPRVEEGASARDLYEKHAEALLNSRLPKISKNDPHASHKTSANADSDGVQFDQTASKVLTEKQYAIQHRNESRDLARHLRDGWFLRGEKGTDQISSESDSQAEGHKATLDLSEHVDGDYDDGSLIDELPDPEVLQDGQDLDPEHKARQVEARVTKEKEGIMGLHRIQGIVESAIAKNREEGESVKKTDLQALKELMNVKAVLDDHTARMQRSSKEGIAAEVDSQSTDSDESEVVAEAEAEAETSRKEQSDVQRMSIAELSHTQAMDLVDAGHASLKEGQWPCLSPTLNRLAYQE